MAEENCIADLRCFGIGLIGSRYEERLEGWRVVKNRKGLEILAVKSCEENKFDAKTEIKKREKALFIRPVASCVCVCLSEREREEEREGERERQSGRESFNFFRTCKRNIPSFTDDAQNGNTSAASSDCKWISFGSRLLRTPLIFVVRHSV